MARVNDTFTDSDSTEITAHVGEGGLTWSYHPVSLDTAFILSNKLLSDNDPVAAFATIAYSSWIPPSPDYEVSADVVSPDLGVTDTAASTGITGRTDTTAETYYALRWRQSLTRWELLRVVGGTGAVIASSTASPPSANVAFNLRLNMRGPLIEGWVGGVLLLQTTDTNITTAGRAGVRMAHASTATTGWHLDNFQGFKARGDALLRRRIYSVFDDEEVNRFEFWPAVGGVVDLVVQDTTHTHTAENVSVTQVHELVVQSASHAHAADNVAVTQVHLLQVQDAVHSHAADNVVVAQTHVLAVQDANHEHSAEQPTLTQVHNLAVENASHSHSADNVAVTQAHSLAVDSALHAHAAESVTVSQVHAIVVQPAGHAHSAENVALTQAHELGVQGAVHAHTADNVTVDQTIPLVVQDAAHGHTADSPSLTQTHVLTVQDGNHSHAADNVNLQQMVQLVVASTVHAHLATSPVLTQVHSLVVASTTHAHTAQNVSLFVGIISIPANRTYVVESGQYEVEVGAGDYEFLDDYEDSEVLVS